jgi:hypothetical protein
MHTRNPLQPMRPLIPHPTGRAALILLVALLVLGGCSTRQIVDRLEGATAQRLVTYSIDRMISELPEAPLNRLQGQRVWMNAHFIRNDPMLDYAVARLQAEINQRHAVTWAENAATAEQVIDVFFTSLGTDKDSFGISLPIPTTLTTDQGFGRIDVIAMDMFHGVSEVFFYIRDAQNQQVVKSERYKTQIRTDKLSLPIMTIPINTLD